MYSSLTRPLNCFCLAMRRFVWIYASSQFALVVVFAHIFYSLVRIKPWFSHLLMAQLSTHHSKPNSWHEKDWHKQHKKIHLLCTTSFLAKSYILYFHFLQMHVPAIISILLATFAGFGIAMSVSSVTVEALRWRRRWQERSRQRRGSQVTTQAENVPESQSSSQAGPSNQQQPVTTSQETSNGT